MNKTTNEVDRDIGVTARRPSARRRQKPLIEQYRRDPQLAMIRDEAVAGGADSKDWMHSEVRIGPAALEMPVAVHRAIGGDSDAPVPGDILCAALAACLDSSLRVVANRLDIEIIALQVTAHADVDVRGTLWVDPSVPVGFQQMRARVALQVADDTKPDRLQKLLQVSEYSCVVAQTLKQGVPLQIEIV
jgi:uncharacterized OsmC-like protein